MEKQRWDGITELKDRAKYKDLVEALADKKTKSVTMHNPGSIITMSDGTKYEVQTKGNWKRIN